MAALALGPSISRALGPAARGATHGHEHHATMMGGHPAGHAISGNRSDAPADPSCVLDCCALCVVAASAFASVAAFAGPVLPAGSMSTLVANRARVRVDERETWSSAAPRGPPSQA